MGAGCSARPTARYKVDDPLPKPLQEEKDVIFNSEASNGCSLSTAALGSSRSESPSTDLRSWSDDNDNVFCQSVGPDIITHGHVVNSNVLWKLSPTFSLPQYVKVGSEKELPNRASKLESWTRSMWSLSEDDEGLKLGCTIKKAPQPPITLCHWRNERSQSFEVHVLQDLEISKRNLLCSSSCSSEMEHSDEVQVFDLDSPRMSRTSSKCSDKLAAEQPELRERRSGSISVGFAEFTDELEIPSFKSPRNQIQVLYPFCIQWTEKQRKQCRVIGCESDEIRSEWVSRLKTYMNIEKRFLVSRGWMQRRTPEKYSGDAVAITDPMRDIRGWKRRLIMLDLLKSPPALCITYVSAKTDVSERIENVLASSARGTRATVEQIEERIEIASTADQTKVTELSTVQYDVITTGCRDLTNQIPDHISVTMEIPSHLSVLEVKQYDEDLGGEDHSLLGFEDDAECKLWLQRIKDETSSLAVHANR